MRKFFMLTFATIAIGALVLTSLSWALKPQSVGPAEAPAPDDHTDAVVQVYGADVWGMRGRFAIHTWVVTKAANADSYRKYQVIGWRLRRGLPVVSISSDRPDGDWFGSPPVLLLDKRGSDAQQLVDAIHEAALSYPYSNEYVMYPGPNSNSFTAWIALEVPQLNLELPAKAIGKSWMVETYPLLQNRTDQAVRVSELPTELAVSNSSTSALNSD
jgi:hypothetical protein